MVQDRNTSKNQVATLVHSTQHKEAAAAQEGSQDLLGPAILQLAILLVPAQHQQYNPATGLTAGAWAISTCPHTIPCFPQAQQQESGRTQKLFLTQGDS